MSELPIISEFENITNVFHQFILEDINGHQLLLKCMSVKESLDQKLHEAIVEKERLTKEVAARERVLQIRTEQEREANVSIRKERLKKKLALRRKIEIKHNVDSLLDILPANIKKDILSRIHVVNDSSSQSDIDVTDSNLSSMIYSETSMSSEDHDLRRDNEKNERKFFPKKSSSLVSASVQLAKENRNEINGQNIDVQYLNVSLGQPTVQLEFPVEVSSSSDSERSSLLLFPLMLDRIKSRPHDLKSRYFVVGDRCNVCFSRIGCGKKGFTCFDCHANVHSLCCQELALPCIPENKQREVRISVGDYCCPTFRPQIPALVIHCISQIEERGLNQVGLYRESVFGRKLEEVKEICAKNRGVPNLSKVKINIICVLLKDFLTSLKGALIPQTVFKNMLRYFANSAGHYEFGDVYNIFKELPIPNRDTLVFLILHLQKVAESPACKMSAKSLSKVFTPLLVEGYDNSTYEKMKENCSVIERFIKMPLDTWKQILLNDF